MIQIENVRRDYEGFALAASFAVGDDEILTLLGSSGSGKTTTLRIIAGFEQLDSGRILIDGVDMAHVPPQHRHIGYVFQDYTLFPHLNVEQNVGYGLRAAGVPPVERRRRVSELLDIVGLGSFGARAVQTLSGGEQQRVAVARALARKPTALLLDEPFSSIDTELREDLRRHLITVQRTLRVPTVFVTHSRNEALSIADRIVVLRAGAIDDHGPPQQLYERPTSAYTARFLGRANIFAAGAAEFGNGGSAGGLLMIRPEHVEIAAADGSGGADGIAARVMRSTYHGMYHEYELDTALGPLFACSSTALPRDKPLTVKLPERHLVPVTGD